MRLADSNTLVCSFDTTTQQVVEQCSILQPPCSLYDTTNLSLAHYLHGLPFYQSRGVAFQYGGVGILLLNSYFTDRKQYVNTNQSISRLKPISIKVSKESILGPLFYIIYSNDLYHALIVPQDNTIC